MTDFDSDISVSNIAQRSRHTRVVRMDPEPGDAFAMPQPPFLCRSRNGRFRAYHSVVRHECVICEMSIVQIEKQEQGELLKQQRKAS